MTSKSPKRLAGPLTREAKHPSPAAERILNAASDLFCRDGIHATGIDRVLAKAGVSKMSLYAHFGGKDALVQAVLEHEGRAWRIWFRHALDRLGGEDPAQRLRAIIPALREWFRGGRFYGCPFMNAAGEHTKGEDRLRALARSHHADLLALLRTETAAAGAADPALLARQLLLLIDGAIAALMVSGDESVLDISACSLDAIISAATLAGGVAAERATA